MALFDPRSGSVRQVYTVTDRLLTNQFNYKSGYKSPDGPSISVVSRVVSFNPETLLGRKTDYVPPIYITDFSLLDEKVLVGGRNSPLRRSIICSDSIRLKHDQNSLTLQIAALSYREPQTNRLLYKLEGFDDKWRQYTPGSATITYSKIPYGKYNFRVRLPAGSAMPARSLRNGFSSRFRRRSTSP